jgi:hypothetical protein
MLQLDVEALKTGREHDGMLYARPPIGTAAMFLEGGRKALAPASIPERMIEYADDCWPDLLLFVEPGRLVVKEYLGGGGVLRFFDLGRDALMAFTSGLLVLLNERSVHVEEPLYFEHYAGGLADTEPTAVLPFRLTRPASFVRMLWRPDEASA